MLFAQFAIESAESWESLVIIQIYSDEIKVFGLFYKEMTKPLAADEDEPVLGILTA
jgi:hypothetical protein